VSCSLSKVTGKRFILTLSEIHILYSKRSLSENIRNPRCSIRQLFDIQGLLLGALPFDDVFFNAN
jgi:hypothetical protein